MEPSNSGPIISIILFSLSRLREKTVGRKIRLKEVFKSHLPLALSYVYVSIFSFSITCIISFVLLLIYILPKRAILIGSPIVICVIIMFIYGSSSLAQRINNLLPALLSFDAVEIYRADSSASARIAPYLVYINEFNLLDPNIWLGRGCDYGSLHVYSFITGETQTEGYGVGGFISFLYDYGLAASILFIIFLVKCCKRNKYAILLYLLIYSVMPVNHYVTWLFFIIIATTDYYQTVLDIRYKTSDEYVIKA